MELKDEDIKKASTCCVTGDCFRCPLDCFFNCRTVLREGMSNIVSKQQIELVLKRNTINDLNNKLTEKQSENEKLQSLCTSKDAIVKEQQAEIERLQKELASKCLEDSLLEREKVEDILVFADDLKRAKSEAIKDCVNKYTEMLIDEYHLRTDLQIESIKRLEQKVLTEMVGGENEKNN